MLYLIPYGLCFRLHLLSSEKCGSITTHDSVLVDIDPSADDVKFNTEITVRYLNILKSDLELETDFGN